MQLILHIALQAEVLNVHDNHGHQVDEQTITLLRERCYWPGMWNDVKQCCSERECKCCIRAHKDCVNDGNKMMGM